MNTIRRTPAGSPEEAGASPNKRQLGGLLLVVEDEPNVLSMVAQHLMAAGFDVCLAPNGEVTLALIRERLPAVVCLDLNLPRISGYDVCEQIRADPAIQDISVLIKSARNSFDVRVFALERGAAERTWPE